jgi:hypothetical protein
LHIGIVSDLLPGATLAVVAEGQTEVPGRFLQVIHLFQQPRQIARLFQVLVARIPAQVEELAGANGDPEETAGHLGQLVSLVDDVGIRRGQQLTKPLVLDGKVGAEQVMIDHHHIRLLSTAPGLHQMATAEGGAFTAQTVVAGGGDEGPHRSLLGQVGQLGDVAGTGLQRPLLDAIEVSGHLAAVAPGIHRGQLHAVQTEIV